MTGPDFVQPDIAMISADANSTAEVQQRNDSRISVGVVYGGRSTEHSISCISAGAVIRALSHDCYRVVAIGITEDGQWTVGDATAKSLVPEGRSLPHVPMKDAVGLSVHPGDKGRLYYLSGEHAGELWDEVDVIIPVLHGPFGEDGTIQGLIEMAGIPYVGAGVLASAACMDKQYTKKLLGASGLPIGREVVLERRSTLTDEEQQFLGLPVFVKPARGGSSIGISKVSSWEDFAAAYEEAATCDTKVIVESEIIGDEVECGVLQYPNGEVVASVPAKLVGTDTSDEGFYGFNTKYLDHVVSAEIPARLDDDTTSLIQTLAIEAFRAVDGEGLARVDFFVTKDGPVINEINTMPGFTPISMYPQVFRVSGIEATELLDIMIQRALNKHGRASAI